MSTGFCMINPRLLAKALHMPDGTEIDNAQWDFYGEQILLRVRHPSILPCPEGCPPLPVHLLITQHTRDVSQLLCELGRVIEGSPDSARQQLALNMLRRIHDRYLPSVTYTGEWK